MIAPRIHLNGDRKETLTNSLDEACDALSKAMTALQQTVPNARNYYPISTEAFTRAIEEHERRAQRLLEVYAELHALWQAIEDGRIEFEAER